MPKVTWLLKGAVSGLEVKPPKTMPFYLPPNPPTPHPIVNTLFPPPQHAVLGFADCGATR